MTRRTRRAISAWECSWAWRPPLSQAAGTVLGRCGIGDYDASAATFLRILGGMAGYLVLVTLLGRWPQILVATRHRRAMGILCLGTLVGPFAGVILFMVALRHSHAGIVSTIVATMPVLILPFLDLPLSRAGKPAGGRRGADLRCRRGDAHAVVENGDWLRRVDRRLSPSTVCGDGACPLFDALAAPTGRRFSQPRATPWGWWPHAPACRPNGPTVHKKNHWPVGPTHDDGRMPCPQGVALGWANCWAFGPVADAGRTALRLSHPAPTGYTVVMVDAPVPKPRWYHLTPDRAVLGLLAVEGFLLLSEWCQWFAFNRHKGYTVLIAWRGCRRGFPADAILVPCRSALSAAVPVQHPLVVGACRGRRRPVQLAGDGDETGEEAAGGSGSDREGRWERSTYDYEFDPSDDWIPGATPPGPPGCGSCWEATCSRT